MDAAAAEKVCHIREQIADRIGANRFRTWFGDSTAFTLEGDRLDVQVENPFVGGWITANFMGEMMAVARAVLGVEPRVDVRVVPAAQTSRPATPGLPAPATGPPAPARGEREATRAGPVLRGSLDTFVVGPPNELAYSAARDLVRNPGDGLRLLVLHSACGLGKTHLLQGICRGVRQVHPELGWRYISGEEFTNEYIYALKTGRVDLFRARFRKVDVLVIDDIHFLANKKATQEEFLHTFNAIDASGKAIVLSSDRHPRFIATLPEPLVNRLVAGMVVQIEAPDLNMRREILRRRASTLRASVSDEVLDFVAQRVTRNVRALEGALYKLVALAALAKEPMDLALARLAVEDYADDAGRPPDPGDIERVVLNYFRLTREVLHSQARDRTVSLARGLAMYLIRKHAGLSFPEIGRRLGNKNHSTALMAVRRVEQALERDGAVEWKVSSRLHTARLRDVLAAIEHDLALAQRASA